MDNGLVDFEKEQHWTLHEMTAAKTPDLEESGV